MATKNSSVQRGCHFTWIPSRACSVLSREVLKQTWPRGFVRVAVQTLTQGAGQEQGHKTPCFSCYRPEIKGSSALPAQLGGESGPAAASEQGSSHDKSVPDLTDSAFQGWTRLVLAPCTKCPLPSPLPRTLSTCSHSRQAPGPPLS